MDTGIQAAALIVIISFAIDRISGGVFFLLSMAGVWNTETSGASAGSDDSRGAQNRAKLAYYIFAGILAAAFVLTFDISMLAALKIGEDMQHEPLDIAFGILVLMCGSDQVATLLKSPHAGKAPDTRTAEKPIEVTGKLTLVEQAGQRAQRD
jgi:hypothetical protein